MRKNAYERGLKDAHLPDDVGILWVLDKMAELEAENKALREVVEIVRELVGDYTITDKRLIKALKGE